MFVNPSIFVQKANIYCLPGAGQLGFQCGFGQQRRSTVGQCQHQMDWLHKAEQVWRVHVFNSATGAKGIFVCSCRIALLFTTLNASREFCDALTLIRSLLKKFCCASSHLASSIASALTCPPLEYPQRKRVVAHINFPKMTIMLVF
jgi:hypothetical protein